MKEWQIKTTEEFEAWFDSLDAEEQVSLDASILVLEAVGPTLGRPHVDTVNGSRHSNMKELRTQHQGRPLRTFFAFDPKRAAILLIGGDKTGDKRFYDRMIPKADDLYDKHLEELKKGDD
ncbi:type II toxin-antitoxin system RelE/ParE family toxin [Roseiconus lacunae]|uniref:type II toxin-antitoxin system RelE/ParE family toxin n=1 Tax=Roseiconus lacunae TaxID=2605694 RepID=UPI00308DEBF7|nr:type II toxin-antitoxin system RelE/ParE family toxin [Stieleria sp. HD01]